MPEQLIDAQVICEWMDPMPDKGPYDFRPWRSVSPGGWWNAEPQLELNEWLPRGLTLNECHLVEEKLSPSQAKEYTYQLEGLWDLLVDDSLDRSVLWDMVHADASTRIAALATVIRGSK